MAERKFSKREDGSRGQVIVRTGKGEKTRKTSEVEPYRNMQRDKTRHHISKNLVLSNRYNIIAFRHPYQVPYRRVVSNGEPSNLPNSSAS